MTVQELPQIPPVPAARGYEGDGAATLRPRYEDIAQDGRYQLTALMPGLGAVWRSLAERELLVAFRAKGILPILRRIVAIGEVGPFSAGVPVDFSGTWRLARETNGDRIFMNMWLEARAPIGSTLAAPPPKDAERVLVGRVFAEHVMTKPFAPPAERKVTRLEAPGLPELPEDEHPFLEAEELVAGHDLETVRELAFGMMHTDSNQHVNSLVYPRLFEEAAASAAIERELTSAPESLLMSAVELRYRKPFFAGERATVGMRLDPAAPPPYKACAFGAFAHAGTAGKPSCTVAAWLR